MKAGNSLRAFCTQPGRDGLLREWDGERNAPLTPETVGPGSHRRVWWRCAAGHQWQSEIRVRTGGAQCPYCQGRLLWVGGNDLATVNPALAKQWDPERNGSLRPSDVLAGSPRYVWWRCGRGHVWRASVLSRSQGSGCPVCTGKTALPGENDLATLFPELAAQWDTERNGALGPGQVTAFSNRKVWWRCGLGHAWQAIVAARTMESSGCPYCTGRRVLPGFNDLATQYPELASQWDETLNGNLTPEMVTPGSHKRVWWRCAEGHVWRALVFSRTGNQRCGCPVCAGRVKPRRGYGAPKREHPALATPGK